ncbi:hypothetical protein HCN51_15240 [Nonomuraea sp. FMUSA5-5]|uniref:Uncharacterized protein n=1 Tax=Nonomuraea composti TaxID=2720023 RepID=A0ABX1AYV0_9ACTN|nr:hypothetical protein [Nonomuraea sp. FMUSA5-5]NJP90795.1 hypothetical protein [Nonomuraea sp. FMUSA5-5]
MNRLLRVKKERGAGHVTIFWEHGSAVGDRDLHADGAVVVAQATLGVVDARLEEAAWRASMKALLPTL